MTANAMLLLSSVPTYPSAGNAINNNDPFPCAYLSTSHNLNEEDGWRCSISPSVDDDDYGHDSVTA